MPRPSSAICVVGAGPRGLAVLERLSANHTAGHHVVVHVVDPHPPGPGRTWRTGQPSHLLMNTVTSQVSQFTDDSVHCAGPVRPGPSLHEWLRRSTADADRAWPGAERLGPDDYPSRAQYGHYLEWVFRNLVANAPDGLRFVVHRATAVALDDEADGQCVTLDGGTRLTGLDAVVLALGHGANEPSDAERRFAGYAQSNGLRYVPPGNPADADLDGIRPAEIVAVRGLGLSFADVLSLLTEGRGGKFVRSPDGLRYLPSGQEPVLYAGSRRGVPHHARGENQKGPSGRHEPLFLTLDAVRRIRATPDATFLRDVWPLLDAEVRAVHHHALVAQRTDRATADRFLAELLAAPEHERTEIRRRHGLTKDDDWDWRRIERPWGGREFTDRADFNRWLVDHLRADARHARDGNVDDPLKAALDVLRDLRNEVRLAIDHGGITGTSYRDEVVGWFTPLNAHLSIGPPRSRIEEMAALIECGVLQVVGPRTQVRMSPGGEGFLIGSVDVAGPDVVATTLIEAHIAEPDLRRSTNPLLRHLLATGQCRPYRIPDGDPGADGYESGGLDITARPYRVVDAAGVAHPRRFAYGVPTEFVHWATAAGIRPGVGSVILEDADAIARAAIALTTASRPGRTLPAPAARAPHGATAVDRTTMFDPDLLQLPLYDDGHRRFAHEFGTWCDSHGDRWEAVRRTHPDDSGRRLVELLGDGGWLAGLDPQNGPQADLRTMCLAREALAYTEDLADFAYSIQSLSATPILRFGTTEQQRRYLPAMARGLTVGAFAVSEKEAGSEVAAVGLTARKNGDGYVLDGAKAWIAHATIADLFVVVARTGEGPGPLGLTAFVVPADTPGVRVEPLDAIAPRSFGHLVFERCAVPAAAVLGRPGRGFIIAMDLLERFRMTVAAAALGFARRACDAALAHTRGRQAYGGTLFDLQLVKTSLADMEVRLNAAGLLTARAAWECDRGSRSFARHSNIAKVYATEAAQETVDAAVQLFGAAGLIHDGVPERLYRQIRSLRIYEGSTDVLRLAIADALGIRRVENRAPATEAA